MPSLTFLTWNLCLLNNSEQAPANWRIDQTEATIRSIILDLDPDVVCFQELPGMVPFIETHALAPANTISHSGTIATLVRSSMAETIQCRALGEFAVLTAFPDLDLTVANVHLEPTKQGNFRRLEMLQRIVNICPTKGLLIAGDTNTRIAEEKPVGELGLFGERPEKPTWDNKRNFFSANLKHTFTAYFTRYFHNKNVVVSEVAVLDEPEQVSNHSFYLSDHFALMGKAEVKGDS